MAFLHDKFCPFLDLILFLFVPHFFLFVEYDIVSRALIYLSIKADGLSNLPAFVVLCDGLKSTLVEKRLFFLYTENMLSVPFLRSAPFFPLTQLIEGDIAESYTVCTLFFPNIN